MDLGRFYSNGLQLEHRHSDGSWERLEHRPQTHDAAEVDPERGWTHGILYACPTCDEQVRVREVDDPAEPPTV